MLKLEILKRRKSIYENLKHKALSFEDRGDSLNEYLNDQSLMAQRDFTLSNLEELKQRVLKSDFIFLGDFHTFDQNIRNALRVIKVLEENDSKFVQFLVLFWILENSQISLKNSNKSYFFQIFKVFLKLSFSRLVILVVILRISTRS